MGACCLSASQNHDLHDKSPEQSPTKSSSQGVDLSKCSPSPEKTTPPGALPGALTSPAKATQSLEKPLERLQSLARSPRQSVIVLAGAGISVSAGIPDFRSPGTGLYHNLQKYNLSRPEQVFELSFFRQNPNPFTMLAKELWPTNFRPTPAHLFVRLLEQKGLLKRFYTQNIDTLERAAGISGDLLVEAHGSFGSGHCINCREAYDPEFIRERIFRDEVPRCTAEGLGLGANSTCGGLVKPDIVFFGERLPEKFHSCSASDFGGCDLVICMGTSLQVQPFASLAHRASAAVPRILVNREVPPGFGDVRDHDMTLLGDCDEGCWRIIERLGWGTEFAELCQKHGHAKPSNAPSEQARL